MLLVAGWEFIAGLVQKARVPSRADWQAAAAFVRAEFRPGDLIAIAPRWAEPLGRAELGDLMPLSMIGRADGRRYGRIFELSIRGAHAEDVAGLSAESKKRFGRVELFRYSQHSAVVTYDLIERFSEAHAQSRAVTKRMLEIDYKPRYGVAIEAQPGEKSALIWDNISDEAWKNSQLVLWFGLHDYYARKNAHGPAEVTVDLDGGAVRVPQRIELDSGLQSLVIKCPEGKPGPHAVRIEVAAASAPNHFVGVLGHVERIAR